MGSQIGTVHYYDVNPKSIENNGSNFFTVGAKLFSIPGKSTKDQIAAEYGGKYWECDVFNPNGS